MDLTPADFYATLEHCCLTSPRSRYIEQWIWASNQHSFELLTIGDVTICCLLKTSMATDNSIGLSPIIGNVARYTVLRTELVKFRKCSFSIPRQMEISETINSLNWHNYKKSGTQTRARFIQIEGRSRHPIWKKVYCYRSLFQIFTCRSRAQPCEFDCHKFYTNLPVWVHDVPFWAFHQHIPLINSVWALKNWIFWGPK
jgi:hypothetical protein